MLRLLGCLMILVFSYGIGMYYYRLEQWHLLSLRRLYQCILQLQGEICYHLTTLPEAFCNVGSKQENEIGDWWCAVGMLLENGEQQMLEIMLDALPKLEVVGDLREEDMHMMKELVRGLGYLDVTMQEKGLTLSLRRLEDLINRTEVATREKKKLYTTLGSLGGCFLMVLLL